MLTSLRLIVFMLIICSGLVASQLAFKKAIAAIPEILTLSSGLTFILNHWLWIALAFMAFSSALWGYVLTFTPLTKAYPLISFSYLIMIVVSNIFFNDPITAPKLAGTLLIMAGTFLILS
jgi:drug/metabolite transporter (DMT)-like permease